MTNSAIRVLTSRALNASTLLAMLCFFAASHTPTANAKPNIVLIMADDIGFECYSGYGSQFYSTPNIDRLAETGAKFTQAYAQPICTPSRVKIMTGRYNLFIESAPIAIQSNHPGCGLCRRARFL